jgi:polyhydroxybutyrate depolymerase
MTLTLHRTQLIALVAAASSCAGASARPDAVEPAPTRRAADGAEPVTTIARPGDFEIELTFQGKRRYYIAHVPPAARAGEPLPVVVNFHGGGGEAAGHRTWSRMDAAADREGFIAVYPSGYGHEMLGPRRLLTWNAGHCCGAAHKEGSDDVGFTVAVLEDLASRTAVDHTRVYATGLSNGGMMSYQIALEAGDRFAAIAPIAGTNPGAPTGAPVAVLHIHSTDDPRALYEGGLGPPFPYTNVRVPHSPVIETVEAWARHNGCAGEPIEGETLRDDAGHTATELRYADCSSGYEVVHWRLGGGAGHVWPGGGPLRSFVTEHVGPSTNVIDANAVMWKFFERHRKPDAAPLSTATDRDAEALRLEDVIPESNLELSFDRSYVRAGVSGAGARPVDDLGGDLTHRALDLGAGISLYSRLDARLKKPSLVRVQAQLGARVYAPEIDALDRDTRFYRLSAGLTGIYVSPGLNLFALYAGAAIAEESETIDSPEVRPLVAGLGTYRFGSRFALLYGGAFTYVFGRPLALPLAGVLYRPRRDVNLALLAPVAAVASYRATPKLTFGALLSATGDRYRISNQGMFAGAPDTIDMSVAGAKLSATAGYRLARGLQLRLEAGVLGPRRIRFTDSGDTLAESPIEPGGFARTELVYAFGDAPF